MSALLSVSEVTVKFGGVVAVEDVSLDIGLGELVGVIGPNGAGKTTLMRVITGLVKPFNGTVALDGEDITNWAVDKRVRNGLALGQQIVKPLTAFTLLENVALASGCQRMASPLQALIQTKRDKESCTHDSYVRMNVCTLIRVQYIMQYLLEPLPLGYGHFDYYADHICVCVQYSRYL